MPYCLQALLDMRAPAPLHHSPSAAIKTLSTLQCTGNFEAAEFAWGPGHALVGIKAWQNAVLPGGACKGVQNKAQVTEASEGVQKYLHRQVNTGWANFD